MFLTDLLRHDLVDLVLPRTCAGCGRSAALLCPGCRAVLARPVLGRTAPEPCPPGLPRLVAGATYDGAVRGALLAHKERGRLALVGPLGDLLARAVALLDAPSGAVLVPVPSARAAVRARGHDHALRLARAAAGADRRALPLLVPRRRLADQAGLDSAARAANLAGAFGARRRLDGALVVLVDDVVTTGVTLVEAARAVRAAGGSVAGAAVVAATQRWPVV